MHILKQGDIFADNYQLVRLVDTGGFADVWEAVFMKASNTVALKIFPKLGEDGTKNIEDEYRNQANLLHTNLVTARNFGIYDGQPYLEMLFFSGGNASKKIGNCNEAEIAKCLHQIANGLSYLHAKEIVHQDIKPNNFLLDEDGNYYLADLGLSVKIRQTIQRYTEAKGINSTFSMMRQTTGSTPPCFRAPELFDRPSVYKPPIKATDIWSLGASIFEMANGEVPFGDMGGIIQVNMPEPPDMPASFSPQLNFIVKKCLSKDTWDRPKASELEEWAGNFRKTGKWPDLVPPEVEKKTVIQETSKSGSSETIVSTDKSIVEPYAKQKAATSKAKIMVIILIVAVLGASGWYFLNSNNRVEKPGTNITSPDSSAKKASNVQLKKDSIINQSPKIQDTIVEDKKVLNQRKIHSGQIKPPKPNPAHRDAMQHQPKY